MRKIFLWFSGMMLSLFAACSVDEESLPVQPQVPSSTITTQLDANKREVQRTSAEVATCVHNFEQQLDILRST